MKKILLIILFLSSISLLVGCSNVNDYYVFDEEENTMFEYNFINGKEADKISDVGLEIVDFFDGHNYDILNDPLHGYNKIYSDQWIHDSIIVENTSKVPLYLKEIETEYIATNGGKFDSEDFKFFDMNEQLPSRYINPGEKIYLTNYDLIKTTLDLSYEENKSDDFINDNQIEIEKTNYMFNYYAKTEDLKKNKKGKDIEIEQPVENNVFSIENLSGAIERNPNGVILGYDISFTIGTEKNQEELDEIFESDFASVSAALLNDADELLGVVHFDTYSPSEFMNDFEISSEFYNMDRSMIEDIERIEPKIVRSSGHGN